MRISDWSSDVCSSDLPEVAPTRFYCVPLVFGRFQAGILKKLPQKKLDRLLKIPIVSSLIKKKIKKGMGLQNARYLIVGAAPMPMPLMMWLDKLRSEEHTSELQSLMRISYAVFCLKNKNKY